MTEKELTVVELTEESIESMVYEIRGQKVMLDSDLAIIYGYSTKAFNQQVKNNKEKLEGQPDKESCCHSPCAALSGSKHWPQPLIISWGRAQGERKRMSLCL